MLRIGITGGIGSGKSVVCSLFERLGAPVLYADQVARDISDSNPTVRKQIKKLLGPESYNDDGSLNRAYVAARLFSDKRIQKKINAVVHPIVQKEIEKWWKTIARKGATIGLIEAALIYEAGLDKVLDVVIVIEADDQTRIERIVRRDGLQAAEVVKRMKAQMDSKQQVKKADYVIRNNGSLEALERNVKFLHTLFQELTHG